MKAAAAGSQHKPRSKLSTTTGIIARGLQLPDTIRGRIRRTIARQDRGIQIRGTTTTAVMTTAGQTHAVRVRVLLIPLREAVPMQEHGQTRAQAPAADEAEINP